MIQQKSLIPSFLTNTSYPLMHEALCFLYGVGILTLLAQISIPLSWTPVPITGQTMGVTLLSLLWGRKRAPLIVLSYLLLSSLGLPLLAGASVGVLGPTTGYLIGMLFASYWLGFLADRGATRKFWSCWLAGISGSLIVLGSGAVGLTYYLPADQILWAGVIPFLPGDFIKTLTACVLVYRLHRSFKKNKILS